MCQVANRNHQMLWFRMLQKRVLQWHVASRNHQIWGFRIAQERFLMWQVSSRNNSRWLWLWEWVRGQVSIRHQVFSFSANCVRCFVVRRKLRAKVREVLQLSERFMWFVESSELLNARGVCVSFFLWERTARVCLGMRLTSGCSDADTRQLREMFLSGFHVMFHCMWRECVKCHLCYVSCRLQMQVLSVSKREMARCQNGTQRGDVKTNVVTWRRLMAWERMWWRRDECDDV